MNKHTLIVACGWLGTPLAQTLLSDKQTVSATTQTVSHAQDLLKQGIMSTALPLPIDSLPEDRVWYGAIKKAEQVVILLPFKRGLTDPKVYLDQLRSLEKLWPYTAMETLILASSTSVYPDDRGEWSEDMPIPDHGERASILVQAEDWALDQPCKRNVVLRFGGLHGADRNGQQAIAKQPSLTSNPNPTNLIHQKDAVRVLTHFVTAPHQSGRYNVVTDEHPSKAAFYQKIAQDNGLSIPTQENIMTKGKIVTNTKLKTELKIALHHPDPMAFYEH